MPPIPITLLSIAQKRNRYRWHNRLGLSHLLKRFGPPNVPACTYFSLLRNLTITRNWPMLYLFLRKGVNQ